MTPDAKKAKKALAHRSVDTPLGDKDFLSTGVHLVDLAARQPGRLVGGLPKGKIIRLIGRSQTSKTFLARTILTEAACNPEFALYKLIHDDVERGALMSTGMFFKRLEKRLQAPRYSKTGEPIFSKTLGDFYEAINKKLDADERFIWVEDSLDSLAATGETKMSDGKAKTNSNELRKLINGLDRTKSILILVQHAKVNMGSSWGGDVTTGGASPEFFSSLDIWLSKLETLKRTVNEKKYPIGVMIRAHVMKNRIAGVDRIVKFPLYYDYGIDDIGASALWLCETGHWPIKKKIIQAEEFKYEGHINSFIRRVENENLQKELRVIVSRVWKEIEAACSTGRKPRYS